MGCSAPCSDRERSWRTECSASSLPPPVNELWSVLPSPRGNEDGVPDVTASLPSSGHSPRHRAVWKEQDSQSASTVALAGSMLSEGQDTSYRCAGAAVLGRQRGLARPLPNSLPNTHCTGQGRGDIPFWAPALRPCVCLQRRHQHRGGGVDRSSAASCPGAEPVQRAVRAESLWGLPGRQQRQEQRRGRPRRVRGLRSTERGGPSMHRAPHLGSHLPLTQRSHVFLWQSWSRSAGQRQPRELCPSHPQAGWALRAPTPSATSLKAVLSIGTTKK